MPAPGQLASWQRQDRLVAGVDEAGRGPLAGPVVAAAVILADAGIDGIDDSKKLSAVRRELLEVQIRRHAVAWAVAFAEREEIDRLNILSATMLAMRRAILGLNCRPALVEIDGNRLPNLGFFGFRLEGNAVVGGDASIESIGAASILAKVWRDRFMRKMDAIYPQYGFARHKGYGTEEHRDAIARYGPCELHRRSFEPVKSLNKPPRIV